MNVHLGSILTLAALATVGCADTTDDGALGAKQGKLEAICVDTVQDAPAGEWLCGEQRVVECDSHAGARVFAIVVVPEDPVASPQAVFTSCTDARLVISDTGPFLLGEHSIAVSLVTDGPEGDLVTHLCESSLLVRDTKPPVVTPKTVELWPANHKMHHFAPLDCVDVMDVCDPDVWVVFTGATSDEALDSTGDGNTDPDIILTCDGADLRAERSGSGDGRVYTLSWRAEDAAGNTTVGDCHVVVPHDQGKGEATDSGDAYSVSSEPPCTP